MSQYTQFTHPKPGQPLPTTAGRISLRGLRPQRERQPERGEKHSGLRDRRAPVRNVRVCI